MTVSLPIGHALWRRAVWANVDEDTATAANATAIWTAVDLTTLVLQASAPEGGRVVSGRTAPGGGACYRLILAHRTVGSFLHVHAVPEWPSLSSATKIADVDRYVRRDGELSYLPTTSFITGCFKGLEAASCTTVW